MLQQARVSPKKDLLEQLWPDFQGMQSVQRIRQDVSRLVAARYFIVFMGAVFLMSLAVQALFLDGGVTLSRVFKVALVSVLGPGLVWAASDKEVRLLRELDKRNRQLEQRVRENKALNQMTQEHLSDCFAMDVEEHPPAPAHPQLRPVANEVFTEAEPAHLRPDYENVVVLDPEDNNYDRRYFEAAGTGAGIINCPR